MHVLGIDGGIASIGWGLIDTESRGIIAAGVRCFDAPETDKERTPTNAVRRLHRGQRRVIRRRAQRMAALRTLFVDHGLLTSNTPDALKVAGIGPWCLRAEALDRPLLPVEFAVALGHIGRHRGFRSNSKREAATNAADETSKMKRAIETTREKLGQWRTVGEMFARDPAFVERKHNRGGDFSRSILRSDHEDEVRMLFAAQRRLGNTLASEALQQTFADIAFTQRALQDSEDRVGDCPFEAGQKRTARRSYGFEMFRLLSRLKTVSLVAGGREWGLTPEEMGLVTADFGRQKKISYRTVRRLLDLDQSTRFAGIAPEEEARDIVARTGNAVEGTATLRDVVCGAAGESAWRSLLHRPALLDRIAEVLTFRNDFGSIERGLEDAGLEEGIQGAIMNGVTAGRFAAFNGTGHISAKAARVLIPHLARGLGYSEACAEVGYDHAAQTEVRLEDIRNPVARKALTEMLKQVRAVIGAHGLPDLIHVELARDIGKSSEERDEITRGLEKQNKMRDRVRVELADLLGRDPNGEEIRRYELWKEQGGRCLYTDEAISVDKLVATDNSVQVDHILPWSRFGDDSFANKTLCVAQANQMKRGRTPFEWFSDDRSEAEWAAYVARVDGCKEMKSRKKRGFYLRRNAKEVEERFRNRNLGDTRYATSALLGLLARLYPKDGQVHVRARPGALTAKLRRAWAVDDLKRDDKGKRLPDDRHHALDALVVAATTQAKLEELTRAAQEAERRGEGRGFDFKFVPEPWPGFRAATRAAVAGVIVSRPERRRARGEAHAATIRQVRERDGRMVVFERKSVDALKPGDLERIKDPERNAATVAALQAWLEAGKPKDAPPLSPKGDVIRKVRLETKGKVAVRVRDGSADRGEMVRVDIFERANPRGRAEYFAVPVYPHQVADRGRWPAPPARAVVAYKEEGDWRQIDDSYRFRFSLYHHSLVEAVRANGDIITGYFKGLDRSTGAIGISTQENLTDCQTGIGIQRLNRLRKLSITRLGRVDTVEQETRTWHGVVCI